MDNNNGQNSFEGENITPNEFVEGVTPTEMVEDVVSQVEDTIPTEEVETTGSFGGGLKLHSDTPVVPKENAETNNQYSAPVDPMNLEPVVTSFGGNGGSNGPKKSGKKVGLICGIVAAVAALVVCAVLFIPKLFKSDKDVVKDAFKAAFESGNVSSGSEYDEEVLGVSELHKTIAEKGGSFDWTATIDSCELLPGMEGASIQLYSSEDIQKKMGYMFLSCFNNTDSIKLLEGYTDGDNIYIGSPEIIDGFISTSIAALETKDEPDSNMAKINKEFSDSIKVKKTGKEKVVVNGNVVKAKEYTVTIVKDDLVKYLKALVDESAAQAKANPEAMAGANSADVDAAFESVKMVIGMIFTKDIEAKVYVDDGKVVKFVVDDSLNIMGMATIKYNLNLENDEDKTAGNISFDIGGEKAEIIFDVSGKKSNPSGNIVVNFGSDSASVKFDTDSTVNGSVVTDKLNASVNVSGESLVKIEYTEDIDKSNNAGTGNMKLTVAEEGEISLDWKAEYSDIEKGKKYCKTLSDINLAVDGESFVTCSVKEIWDVNVGDVPKMDSSAKVYDYNALSDDEFSKVINDNYDNIEKVLERVAKIFGVDEGVGDFGYIEDIEEITDIEDGLEDGDSSNIDDVKVSSDDMILTGDNVNVKILGSMDGFELEYATGYSVSFADEEYNYISYQLYGDYNEVDDLLMVDDDDLFEGEVVAQGKTEVDIDGLKAYYAVVKDDDSMLMTTSLRIVLQLEDGSYLYCLVSYDGDKYEVNDLLNLVSKKYYEIVE